MSRRNSGNSFAFRIAKLYENPLQKMVCNAWVLLSMLLGKSLLEKFSVWANVNCPCSSILTVLTKSKKSLFFVYILGEFGKTKFFASTIGPMRPPSHDFHKIELSSSSHKTLQLILKCKEPLYQGQLPKRKSIYTKRLSTCRTIFLLVQVFPLLSY